MNRPDVIHLHNGGTSVVFDISSGTQPIVVYWGPHLVGVGEKDLADIALAAIPQRVSGGQDLTPRLTLIPLAADGWLGTPGLKISRQGGGFSTVLELEETVRGDARATFVLADAQMGVSLCVEAAVNDAGLFTQSALLKNEGATPLHVEDLRFTFPLSPQMTEILDPMGHHLRERFPQRHDLTFGTYQRTSRAGRPSADAPLLMCAGQPGFGFEGGRVHSLHLAWSGSFNLGVEKTTGGDQFLMAGEYLEPGEVVLAPEGTYDSPKTMASWGDGLTQLSRRYIETVRAAMPPSNHPVTLNTWEAVYFDHNFGDLAELADVAREAGVERFVLDDGWFRGRRDDTTSLGDWIVDERVWPDGLAPLINHVTGLGMEFGLWVEPEMISPDSDLARAHPDWVLRARTDLPPSARTQQVLDLSNPAAYDHIRDSLLAILDEYDISYLKWDHNRDLITAGDGPGGRPRARENVLALYRLLDELRDAHPGLVIESCASGGARVDAGVLEHTSRVWTSDCLDPLERLSNQKYTGLLVPPEVMGAHITSVPVHSTNRTLSRDLSAKIALLGHFGIESDLRELDAAERAEVAHWVAVWKTMRHLVEGGFPVHADLFDTAMDVRGLVSRDAREGVFTITQVATSACHPPAPVHFPGLDPALTYMVECVSPAPSYPNPGQSDLAWLEGGLETTGQLLSNPGVRPPLQFPGDSAVLKVWAV